MKLGVCNNLLVAELNVVGLSILTGKMRCPSHEFVNGGVDE